MTHHLIGNWAARMHDRNATRDSFLHGSSDAVVFGIKLTNPCVYRFSRKQRQFSLPKLDRSTDLSRTEFDFEVIASKTLDQKPLSEFSEEETAYYLSWLSDFSSFKEVPPHCFSRFFDAVFHRALIEGKDQLDIIDKCIDLLDIISTNYDEKQITVIILRFVFAVLNHPKQRLPKELKARISGRLNPILGRIPYYYFKPGWDWNPLGWYYENKQAVPDYLFDAQSLAELSELEDWDSAGSPVLTDSYYKQYTAIAFIAYRHLKRQLLDISVLSGFFGSDSKVKREIRSFQERFEYQTGTFAPSSEYSEESIPELSKINRFLSEDCHKQELVIFPEETNYSGSMIGNWLALPADYQKELLPLFISKISEIAERQTISIDDLFSEFGHLSTTAKKLTASELRLLEAIERVFKMQGYFILSDFNFSVLCHSSIVSFSKEEKRMQTQITQSDLGNDAFLSTRTGVIKGIIIEAAKLNAISIPNEISGRKITCIGKKAFQGLENLVKVQVQDGIEIIKQDAFSLCSNLESIKLPSSIKSIESAAFCNCSKFSSVHLPDSVELEKHVFTGCSSLLQVSNYPKASAIPDYCFSYCTSLAQFEIPKSVDTIGDFAFSGCSSLTRILIPASVTHIGYGAFSGCSSLIRILIPASVTHIDGGAFSECKSLQEVVIKNPSILLADCVFDGCPRLKNIDVLSERVNPREINSYSSFAMIGPQESDSPENRFKTIHARIDYCKSLGR